VSIIEGRFAEAERLARQAVSQLPDTTPVSAYGRAVIAWALLEQGAVPAAVELGDRARADLAGSEHAAARAAVDMIAAVVDGYSADPRRQSGAPALLDDVVRDSEAVGSVADALWARYARSRVLVRLGRPEAREAMLDVERRAAAMGATAIVRLARQRLAS
jgi:hypothetical protein